jgi:hypothetical protein
MKGVDTPRIITIEYENKDLNIIPQKPDETMIPFGNSGDKLTDVQQRRQISGTSKSCIPS